MKRKEKTIRLEHSKEYAIRHSMSQAKKVYLTPQGKAILENRK